MPDPNLERRVRKSYLYIIRTAVGSELFKHIYVVDKTTGKEFDALGDGRDACAYVVSGILALVGLIDHPHATVVTTVQKMLEGGWRETKDPKPGDIIHWAAKEDLPNHMGFLLEDGMCMYNSSSKQVPVIVDSVILDNRQPNAYYTHDLIAG